MGSIRKCAKVLYDKNPLNRFGLFNLALEAYRRCFISGELGCSPCYKIFFIFFSFGLTSWNERNDIVQGPS